MRRLLFMWLAALWPLLAFGAEPAVSVSGAWISEAPPGAGVAAGYLDIRNTGSSPVVLTGASAPRFGKVEIHRSETRGGVASMQRQAEVEIAAGRSVHFAPGGLHLMLFRDPPLPREGDVLGLTLHFADGSTITVDAPVRRPGSHDHSH